MGRVKRPKEWIGSHSSIAPSGRRNQERHFQADATGKWYITRTGVFQCLIRRFPGADPFNVVGIDLRLKEFAVLSDGVRVPVPFFERLNKVTLARLPVCCRKKEIAGAVVRQK